MKRTCYAVVFAVSVVGLTVYGLPEFLGHASQAADNSTQPNSNAKKSDAKPIVDKAALERTREQIKMLDDLYKTAVVGITQTYVEQQADTPAAAVAKQVFAAMHKKGWHKANLVDATGRPRNKANLPKTEFEKKGVAQMKEGKTYYEEIGQVDGKPVLRVATVVPSVLPVCATCHGGKQGRLLGAIIYEVPIK